MCKALPMFLLVLLTCFSGVVFAQNRSTLDQTLSFPDKLFNALNKKAGKVEAKLDKATARYLAKLAKQEKKLHKQLNKKDSALSNQLFAGVESNYRGLQEVPNVGKPLNGYCSHLDSLITALHFLKDQNLTTNPQLQKAVSAYTAVQDKLKQADAVKTYLKRRQALLQAQLGEFGILKEFKKYKQQVYYYRAQVQEHRTAFEDPSRLEARLMAALLKLPRFKEYFARNSMLGSLFRFPGSNPDDIASPQQKLQTRASVNQLIQSRFGTSVSTAQLTSQTIQSAQSKLAILKQEEAQYSNGKNGQSNKSLEQPDFKPNNQKTKSFLKRLEYGGNVQSQRARYAFPVTSDIGLSVGYKVSDKSVVGVGGSYKLGLGRGWNNMALSHQGIGLRSYADYTLKRSFFISGGYEHNYRSRFSSIEQPRNYSAWQSSALIGISKRYSISKKLKGNMQLLWDFLSYQQVPRTEAVLFRVGYELK